MQPSLAVTGIGIASPMAVGHQAWRQALSQPDPRGVFTHTSRILSEDVSRHACVAELSDFDAKTYLGDKGLRNLDRLTKLLIVAARSALQDAGIKNDGAYVALSPQQVGLCSSTAYGSLEAITELKLVAELEDPRYLNPARFPNTVINAAAGYVSIWEDLRAPNVTLVNGNCGALDAVLSCATHLSHARGDAFLVGGGEALTDALYLAFEKLGVVANAEQRFEPGDSASEGMRLGEGAAYLCVERHQQAKDRGARIWGRIRGYGSAFEIPTSEAELVHASPLSVKRALTGALNDAGMEPSDVDFVCLSVSGIAKLDHAEIEAAIEVFGDDILLTAPKRLCAETLGAAGGFSMAAALSWLNGVPISTVIHGQNSGRMKTAVVVSMGYYGNVSAVVIEGEA